MGNSVNTFIKKSSKVAIYYNDTIITYDTLYKNVCRYANCLSKHFDRGDTIAIKMSDSPVYFYLFWGAVKAGIIPQLVSTMLSDEEYAKLIKSYPVKRVFTDNNIIDFDMMAVDPTDHPAAEVKDNDLCFHMFSSGTTGYIKRIPHKHKDMEVTAANYARDTLGLKQSDVCYSAAKLFFAYGFGNSMTFPLYVGASTVIVSDPSSAKTTLDVIEKYKPTVYFGVPTIYAQQLNSLKNNYRNLSSLRVCVSAGEPLPGKILEEWVRLTGVPILDGIGSTEALHIFISNTEQDYLPNCSGQVVTGYKAKVLDAITGKEVADGNIGDLYISGDSLSDNTEWMATGDMYIKQGSHFYYQGRTNDMLKIGGVWVSPIEIEAKIIEHVDVMEAGVVLASDINGLTKPKAYVVLKDPLNKTIAVKNSIKRKCMAELPANHYPQWIEFVDQLPKTATGKIKRHMLRIFEAMSPPDLNE